MEIKPSTWDEMLLSLEMETLALGHGVAWEEQRVRQWWDASRVKALTLKLDSKPIGFVDAYEIDKGTFSALEQGFLDPEELDLAKVGPPEKHFWIGIILIHPDYRGRGLATKLLQELSRYAPGRFIGDAYSPGGVSLGSNFGIKVSNPDSTRPLFITPPDDL